MSGAPSPLITPFRGVNLSANAMRLDDNELTFAMNAYPVEQGIVSRRPNVQSLAFLQSSAGKHIPDCFSDSGLFQFIDHLGKNRVLAWWRDQLISGDIPTGSLHAAEVRGWGDETARVAADLLNVIVPADTSFTQEISTWIPARVSNRPSFVSFNGRGYLFFGDKILQLEAGRNESVVNGTWQADVIVWDAGTAQLSGNIACEWLTQCVLAGVDAYPDMIFFSDPLTAGTPFTSFASLAKGVRIGGFANDPIVGLAVMPMLSGANAVEPYLVVFKRNSVWLVTGTPPTSTGNGSLRISPVLQYEGCVSKETICHTPEGLVWCSGRNVYAMAPGQLPTPIGADIAQYLLTLNQAPGSEWHGSYDAKRGCYRLSVPAALGNGYGPDTAAVTPNIANLVPMEQWWCDLRGGLDKVSWWGPHVMWGVGRAIEYERPGGKLLALAAYDHVSNGGTLDLVSLDEFTDTLTDWNEVMPPSGAFVQSPMKLVSKTFNFGNPMLKKIIEALDFFYSVNDVPSPSVDYDDIEYGFVRVFTDSQPRKLTGESGTDVSMPNVNVPVGLVPSSAPFVLDTSKLDEVEMSDGWVAIAAYPASSKRIVTRLMRFEIYAGLTVHGDSSHTNTGQQLDLKLADVGIRFSVIGRNPTQNRKD